MLTKFETWCVFLLVIVVRWWCHAGYMWLWHMGYVYATVHQSSNTSCMSSLFFYSFCLSYRFVKEIRHLPGVDKLHDKKMQYHYLIKFYCLILLKFFLALLKVNRVYQYIRSSKTRLLLHNHIFKKRGTRKKKRLFSCYFWWYRREHNRVILCNPLKGFPQFQNAPYLRSKYPGFERLIGVRDARPIFNLVGRFVSVCLVFHWKVSNLIDGSVLLTFPFTSHLIFCFEWIFIPQKSERTYS